jgi:hypothetical protein
MARYFIDIRGMKGMVCDEEGAEMTMSKTLWKKQRPVPAI